ncbi:dNA/RNA-binding protein [Clostridium sp. CAG:273]|nr:RNA-binding cell elongation regulator Jag/EloR [Clostridia bacterium]CDE84800.1 dNA/RNA-binding protein [Clostridium sp. CAG:273]
MQNSIISEGKTTNEAIENGLKKLGVTKKDVEIKVLEEEKKSFFDILAPRIVKVELILKEGKKEHREVKVGEKDIEEAVNKTKDFLNDLKKELGNIEYAIEIKEDIIYIKIEGEKAADLIGYRGETLESIQNIISAIANKETSARVKIIVDILNYKEKRRNSLEILAKKVEKTVIKSGKPYRLEPMNAYERKIIHTALQESSEVTTNSVGEEPYRRVIVRKK